MQATDLIDGAVITAHQGGTFIYKGESDNPRFVRIGFSMGHGGHPNLRASFESVAPADIEIPAKSDRVNVIKHEKKPFPWAAGRWQLEVNGERYGYHKTKRDATAEGLRRVAIMDWHEAQLDAATEAYMNGHGTDVQDDAEWNKARETVGTLIAEGEG